MNKGFVILAQNTLNTDYIKCAEVLAHSIKKNVPNSKIALITDDIEHSKYFDYVIALPYGDLDPNSTWKLLNDWQVYEASPFDYTIKIEADIYIPTNIDFWWEVLSLKELVVCSTIRDYKGNISHNRTYRSFIDNNNLPDVYNALTYFKKGQLAKSFFKTCRYCFENWDTLKILLKCNVDELPTTDWIYSIACAVHGVENTTLPYFTSFSMIHMKQFINDLQSQDWTKELLYEINDNVLRVNTFPQMFPFHYHTKNFSAIIENEFT